jgi:hypothetical protein
LLRGQNVLDVLPENLYIILLFENGVGVIFMLNVGNLDFQVKKSGCYPPYIPDPKEHYIFHGLWYKLPDNITGLIVRSPEELVELVKNADVGSNSKIVGGLRIDDKLHPDIFTELSPNTFLYYNNGAMVSGKGFIRFWGNLEYNGNRHMEFKIGYKCTDCNQIISGVPKLEVIDDSTWLKILCANKNCNEEMLRISLDYNTYHPKPEDLED